MKQLTTREIVDQLIGKVSPTGETTEDTRRYDNLEELIQLTDSLLETIESVAECRFKQEHSMKVLGEKAYSYRNNLTKYDED